VASGYRPALAVTALLSLVGGFVALAIRRPARQPHPAPQSLDSRPLPVPEAVLQPSAR
jgi:hypothetical protein